MIVSLRNKQVGAWGYVALLDVKREAADEPRYSIIHHVVVTTEEIDCKSGTTEKLAAWCWEVTEEYGTDAAIVEMIQMTGLGPLYKDNERLVQTVRGEWWVQGVKNGQNVTHTKNLIVDIPQAQSSVHATDFANGRVKQGDVEVTLPNVIDGSKEAKEKAEKAKRLAGELVGEPRSAKSAYEIEYQWRKCAPTGGDMTFTNKTSK